MGIRVTAQVSREVTRNVAELLAASTRDVGEHWAELTTPFWKIAEEIATAHGTPFFLYFPHRAAAAFQALVGGSANWGSVRIAYSLKTNPLPALLRDLNRWGASVEVVSAWEHSQARGAKFPSDRIVFNGPLKSEDGLRVILPNAPFSINVDSVDELVMLEHIAARSDQPLSVGVRICPPRADGVCSRFGIEVATGEADETIARILGSRSLRLRCVHFHLGTQVQDSTRYHEMVALARALWISHKVAMDVSLDIGGGFPYEHDRHFNDQPFRPSDFFGALAATWGPGARPPLVIEPGRFIAAPAMALVSRVLSRKPRLGEPTIVVLDSGTNHNVMAAFFEHLWSFEGVTPDADYRFCGPLCMEDDILSGRRYSSLPARGALVATLNTGAYSLALLRTFIQPPPQVFLVRQDGRYEVLDRRTSFDEVDASRL